MELILAIAAGVILLVLAFLAWANYVQIDRNSRAIRKLQTSKIDEWISKDGTSLVQTVRWMQGDVKSLQQDEAERSTNNSQRLDRIESASNTAITQVTQVQAGVLIAAAQSNVLVPLQVRIIDGVDYLLISPAKSSGDMDGSLYWETYPIIARDENGVPTEYGPMEKKLVKSLYAAEINLPSTLTS